MTDHHRKGLHLLAGVAMVCILGCLGLLALPALAGMRLVDAPNAFGHVANCQVAAPEGADRELWVEVGPPTATLHGWVYEPTVAPRGTILITHGIEGHAAAMADVALAFEELGFRAVAVDLRGHGCSTGDWATYGTTDARDLSLLLDALPESGPVGVYGLSLIHISEPTRPVGISRMPSSA